MRIAIIDLGTNSVRFDIHQFNPSYEIKRLHREKIMVRLGEGFFLTGKLHGDAIRRTLHAFVKFKHTAEQLGVHRILAFATSALRDARDANVFINLIYKKTKIKLRIISGLEESKLIGLGILKNERIHQKCFALVDIGGGSTETSICVQGKVIRSHSFQLGTARLQQLFLKNTPPHPKDVDRLREFIRRLIQLKTSSEKWPKVKLVVGSSGTIRALIKIFKKIFGHEWIERGELQALIQLMTPMKAAELLKIPGMEAKRIDLILAGAILLDECMGVLGADRVKPTEYSLRDGILEEQKVLLKKGKKTHLSLHLEELYRQAQLFGKKEKNLRSMVNVAETIFQKLKNIHQLDLEWGVYLSAATILRDVGEIISLSTHSEQSYYIITHCDLPIMEEWEVDLIANLCRYHEGVKCGPKIVKFYNRKVKLDTFLKLLGMLRIVNSVDTHPEKGVSLKSVRVTKKNLYLHVSKKQITGLENQYLESEKELFEKVFKRSVQVIAL